MHLRNRVLPHEPIFGQTTIFFTYAFHAGTEVPFDVLAGRLLQGEVAECVASAATGEIKVAPNLAKLRKIQETASTLADAERILTGKLNWGEASWRTRLIASRILLNTAGSIVFRRTEQSGADNGSERSSTTDAMEETINEIDESTTNRLLQLAVHSHVDRKLYVSGYLDTEPYLRLDLRPFGIRYESSDGPESSSPDEFYDDWINPTVLLHRSGVVLMTMGLRLPQTPRLEDLLSQLSVRHLKLSAAHVPEPIVESAAIAIGASKERFAGTWTEDVREGVRWRDCRSTESFPLEELFQLYQDALFASSGVPIGRGDWFCYPTVFIENLRCCGSQRRWLRRHRETLGSLAARADLRGRVRSDALRDILEPDLSMTTDQSLYIPGGMTTCVNWSFQDEADMMFGDYLMRTTVTESALLQYWQLVALDDAITASRGTFKELVTLQRTAIYGLDELQRTHLAFGTASDIEQRTFEMLGGPQLYSRIRSRLADAQQLISAQVSTVAGRRANRFALAAVVAALLLGLPAIKQSIEVVQKAVADRIVGWPLQLRGDELSIDGLALVAYVCLVGVVALAYALGTLFGRRGRHYRRAQVRDIGEPWQGPPIRVSFEGNSTRTRKSLANKLRQRLANWRQQRADPEPSSAVAEHTPDSA